MTQHTAPAVAATVENLENLVEQEARRVRAAADCINARPWALEAADYALRDRFGSSPGYLVYRGGSHVALILNGERVLIAAERRS